MLLHQKLALSVLKTGRKEEHYAMRSAKTVISMMDQVVPFASNVMKATSLSEVSAGKAGGPISHVIHITEELMFSNAEKELSDKELYATRSHLRISTLLLESHGKSATVKHRTVVVPCVPKTGPLAIKSSKNWLAISSQSFSMHLL